MNVNDLFLPLMILTLLLALLTILILILYCKILKYIKKYSGFKTKIIKSSKLASQNNIDITETTTNEAKTDDYGCTGKYPYSVSQHYR